MRRLCLSAELLDLLERAERLLGDGRKTDRTRIGVLDSVIADCQLILRRHRTTEARRRIHEVIYACTQTKAEYGWKPPLRDLACKPRFEQLLLKNLIL